MIGLADKQTIAVGGAHIHESVKRYSVAAVRSR